LILLAIATAAAVSAYILTSDSGRGVLGRFGIGEPPPPEGPR
jgi:hypothetical protein